MSVPAGGIAGFRIDRPVAALDAPRDEVVDEGVLPGRIRADRHVAPAVAVADAGLATGPVEVAAELADHHGVALVLEIAEVLFPAAALERRVDNDVASRVACRVALEPRALWLRRIHEAGLHEHRWAV